MLVCPRKSLEKYGGDVKLNFETIIFSLFSVRSGGRSTANGSVLCILPSVFIPLHNMVQSRR